MARYALIIGIAEYVGSFKSLETPVQNANAIAEILDRHGDFNQVKRLPFRREAGQKDLGVVIRKPLPHATLVQELQQFLEDADGSDVLLYYSGHGFTRVDPLSNTYEGFLASSDCQVELNAAGQITAEKNGISLTGLNALIDRHTFNSLVVILDCCNAGAFLESGMVRRSITAFGYERDYYLITACRGSSKSYEGEEYSLLTAAVLKGLSQANAAPESGRISGDRLFDVIGNELHNSRQEPIRMGWGRLITLVRYLQPLESAEPVSQAFNPANPYMGLKPFEREEAAYFFGREQAVRSLLDRLDANRFLAVIGPSGCGKSSLVRAGLLPKLEQDYIPGSRDWQVEIITPGQYPLQALTNALERHRSDAHSLVLFVDQFEELFTLCPNEEEQRTFIKRLDQETSGLNRQTRIIIALRGDFLDRCAKFQESADLINSTAPTTYIVIPLTEAKLVAELEESITCPAGLHGVSFESGLIARIIDDVINQPGAMPLLQYALTQLWDNCISPGSASRFLTIKGYEAIEGVKGALQRWATQFYTNLSPSDQAFVRELISELVQLGDEGEVTRRRAPRKQLREAASQEQRDRIIDCLVYQRLLVADDKTVEVAHEALLSESRLIQGWIEDNREGIRLQQRLEIYRREWEEHDLSENYLLDAGRLAAIDAWIKRKQPQLTSVDQEFIGLSRERRDREHQQQIEQERKLREEAEARANAEEKARQKADELAIAESETRKAAERALRAEQKRLNAEQQRTKLAIAAVLGIGTISIFGTIQWRTADQEQVRAQANFAQASFTVNRDTFDASLEALKAGKQLQQSLWFHNDPKLRTKVMEVLAQTTNWVRETNRLEGHKSYINAVKFSPSGQFIATAGFDNVAKLWTKEGKEIQPLKGHSKFVTNVSISPDEQFVATASYDKTVKVWNLKGENLATLQRHTGTVWGVAIDANSQLIASAGEDSTIHLWKPNGQFVRVIEAAQGIVYAVAFRRDGTLISAGEDGSVKVWTSQGQPVQTLIEGKRQSIIRMALSPDEKILATTGKPATLWQSQTGQFITLLKGIDSEVKAIAFSPDGQTIATGHADSTIGLWNLQGELLAKLEGHRSKINSVSFSSDGSMLASASDDSTVKLWSLKPWIEALGVYDRPVLQVSFSQNGRTIAASSLTLIKIWDQDGKLVHNLSDQKIYATTLSPNGKLVASSSGKQVKLWRIQRHPPKVLGEHKGTVLSIAFSPSQDTIVSASTDGFLKFWTSDGKPVSSFQAHSKAIHRVVFSSDGTRFATASLDNTIRIWSRDRRLLFSLEKHKGSIYDISFSPDGQWLATVSEDRTLKIWSWDGTLLHDIKAHDAAIWGVSISKDGKIATVSDDGLIKLWTSKGEPIITLVGHTKPVNKASFSPDGTVLVTGSNDRRVLQWSVSNLTVDDLVNRGCQWLQNYLQHKPDSTEELCRDRKN